MPDFIAKLCMINSEDFTFCLIFIESKVSNKL